MFIKLWRSLVLLLMVSGMAAGALLLVMTHQTSAVHAFANDTSQAMDTGGPAGYTSTAGQFTQISAVLTFPTITPAPNVNPPADIQTTQMLSLTSQNQPSAASIGITADNGSDNSGPVEYFVWFSANDAQGKPVNFGTSGDQFPITPGHQIEVTITYNPSTPNNPGGSLNFQATDLTTGTSAHAEVGPPAFSHYGFPPEGLDTASWNVQWNSFGTTPEATPQSPFQFAQCNATSGGHNYNLDDGGLGVFSTGSVSQQDGSALTPGPIQQGTDFQVDRS
jgi:hypothetical protein